MGRKTALLFLLSICLLPSCKSYARGTVSYANGLSCQTYTDYRFFEWSNEGYNYILRQEGADCSFVCPDGTVKQRNISGTTSPLYAASRAALEAQFCSSASGPTPTAVTVTPSPVPTASPAPTLSSTVEPSLTPDISSTEQGSATPDITPTIQASATPGMPAGAQSSLLTGRITMCDIGGNLISFRIAQPAPDLTGKIITAQIAERESTCYVNQTNPSLLTCTLPAGVIFPARVVISLDGALVNDFTYDGLGCARLTTPIPTTTP